MAHLVYEDRLTRIMENLKQAYEKASNQAAIFVEDAEVKGEEYVPGEDPQPASAHAGFVFVTPPKSRLAATAHATTEPPPCRDHSKDPGRD